MKHKKAKKIYFTIGLLVFGLLAGRSVFAGADFYAESFDEYNLGNLAGQGTWSTGCTTTLQVVNDQYFDGDQSMKFRGDTSTGCTSYPLGGSGHDIAVDVGNDNNRIGFWLRPHGSVGATSQIGTIKFAVRDGAGGGDFVYFNFYRQNVEAGKIKVNIDTIVDDVNGILLDYDVWTYMEINLNLSDNTYRYKANGNDYASGGSFTARAVSYIDGFAVNPYGNNNGNYINFDKFGTIIAPDEDIVNYQGNDYYLGVVYPPLDQNNRANVQPHEAFQIKLRYIVPDDKKATTQFYAEQCTNTDMTDCDGIATNTIQDIEDTMPADLKGYIIFTAPVVVDQTTLLFIKLGDNVSQKKIIVNALALTGVNDPTLPWGEGASGFGGTEAPLQEDLGFWGNQFRFLFVPTSTFMNTKLTDFATLRDEKFPAYGQITAVISPLETALASGGTTAPTLPTMSLFGANNMQMINTAPLDNYIVQIRGFISVFLWFFCAIYSVRAVHSFFKPESKIDTNI